MLSTDRTEIYAVIERISPQRTAAIDEAAQAVIDVFTKHRFPADKGDAAENLVGAIARYMLDSAD